MTEKLSINQQPIEDRPREKLMAHGAESLSKAELLAILIGSGNSRETAVELMQRVLNDCHESLTELSRMSLDSLQNYKGVGPAKAVTVLAACELGRRRSMERASQLRMDNAKAIADYFRPMLQDKAHEECHLMLLRNNLTFMSTVRVSEGGLTASVVDIRQVLRPSCVSAPPWCSATTIPAERSRPASRTRTSRTALYRPAGRLTSSSSTTSSSPRRAITVSWKQAPWADTTLLYI